MCEILKVLVLSTGHISEKTSNWLTKMGYAEDEYGFWLPCVCFGLSEAEVAYMPEDLRGIMRLAESKECQYVRLDCDAGYIDDLEKFVW